MPVLNIQKHDQESLGEIVKEYKRLIKALELAMGALEEDGIDSLDVANNTWLDKGLIGTRKFVEAVREAHYKVRVARGAYVGGKRRK